MSNVTSNLSTVINRMPKLTQLVPNFARATLRAVAPSLAEKSIGPTLARFNTSDLLQRLVIPVTEDDPDTDAILDITDHCENFVKQKDWVGLADYLRQMDQTRVAVPSGKRILEVVLHFLRDSQSELYEAPNEINFETSYVYSQRFLDSIEAAHLENPDHYMLAALLGRLQLDCAWSARGSKPFEDVDIATRNIMRDHLKIISNVVTNYDPIAYNSPLLGEVQYGMIALKHHDLDRLKNAFDDWVELDPVSLTPYRHHAFFLNSLFAVEDDEILATEAHRAMTLGEDLIGAGGYAAMYLHALPIAPDNFAKLDTNLFIKGFEDLVETFEGNAVRLTYLLEEVVRNFPLEWQDGFAKLSRIGKSKSTIIRAGIAPVIRKHIDMLYAVAWDLDEEDFLHAVAPSFQEELLRGANVEITEGGLLVTENKFAS